MGNEILEGAYRKLVREAELPKAGRGSAAHWRQSEVQDWGGSVGRGRRNPSARRYALEFQRLRDSVRDAQQQGRNGASPVRW